MKKSAKKKSASILLYLAFFPFGLVIGAASLVVNQQFPVQLYVASVLSPTGAQVTIADLKTASLTGYETLPVSIAKWELGVVIFIIGALVYNYNQNTLNRKKNMEFSWVLVGLMTQGAILAIGAY